MNIVYIYGWNSGVHSRSATNLRMLLPKCTVHSVAYDQLNPVSSIDFFNKFIVDNTITAVVASSFGAFIGIHIAHSVHKYLINPCLMPSNEVPKLEHVSPSFIEQCQHIENTKKIVDDEDMRFTTAFFADHDELFSYKKQYLEAGYTKFVDLVNERHQISYEGLTKVAATISTIL